MKLNSTNLVMLIAGIALIWAIFYYSGQKSGGASGMAVGGASMAANASAVDANVALGGYPNMPEAPGMDAGAGSQGGYSPVDTSGVQSEFESVSGVGGTQYAQPPMSNPADLLPQDMNSEWAKLNPMGVGDVNNGGLLRAGYHIGRDTVMSSLRNANLQIRSEPPNPQMPVGPWNMSTIEPDINRKPFEIGSM